MNNVLPRQIHSCNLRAVFSRYAPLICFFFILQLIAYSYLFTSFIISDHTFPNILKYPYPSYKTLGEGRWMADLVIAFQGGSGVPSFQMVCAGLIQSVNSIIFTRFIGIKSHKLTLCMGSVLCLYPLFLDYYSFESDHISFTFADLLCLTGGIALLRVNRPFFRISIASTLFILALGIYGAKISLVTLILLMSLILSFSWQSKHMALLYHRKQLLYIAIREIALAFCVLSSTLLFSALISKLVIKYDIGFRAKINTPTEAITQALLAYREVYRYFRYEIGGLPPWAFLIVIAVIVFGIISIAVKSSRCGRSFLILCFVLLLCFPLALHSPWIINNEIWRHAGRVQSANAYALVFFLGTSVLWNRLRIASESLSIVLSYFFLIHATQQSRYALIKSNYELNIINRIALRIEPLIQSNGSPQALVVVGNIPVPPVGSYVNYPDESVQLTDKLAFASYRQVEFLNFFMGRRVLRTPEPSEIANALRIVRSDGAVWPSMRSIKRHENMIIVVMEKVNESTSITWPDLMRQRPGRRHS